MQREPSLDTSSASQTDPIHHKQTELRVKFGKRQYRYSLREELVRTTTNLFEFSENTGIKLNAINKSALVSKQLFDSCIDLFHIMALM